MADMAEAKHPLAGRWTTTLIGGPVAGLFGIFAAKVLDQLGWLDGPARETAALVQASVESALVANSIGFLIFALLYGLLLRRVWRPVHVYDTEHGERLGLGDRFDAEIAPAPLPPRPDMSISEVVERIKGHLPPPPRNIDRMKDYVISIDRAIMDAIVIDGLHVWGRFGHRPIEELPPLALRRATVLHQAKVIRMAGDQMRYTDISFNRAQIDAIWSEKQE